MSGDKKQRAGNEPEPRPIIVKKIIADGHGGHHGGAWKVAYADFVTAMMAFFLLMWLLGATTEKQRKGLADYFTPTLVEMKMASAGSNGLFGGDSLMSKENYPTTGGQGNLAITIPRDASGVKEEGGTNQKSRSADMQKFEKTKRELEKRMAQRKELKNLRKNVRFTQTRDGLRIDIIDEADFSMFQIGTDQLTPQARKLISEVADVVNGMPNDVIVTGHTDALPYAAGRSMNNWLLSSTRAEATRKVLAESGVENSRFARIEGVADRDPFVPGNLYDPRNRRMSITLAWGRDGTLKSKAIDPAMTPEIAAAIRERDDPIKNARTEARALDMGRSGLPAGAVIVNAAPKGGGAAGKSATVGGH